MKIAYLILCHKNSTQVNSLIKMLNTNDVEFFVHIDKKVKTFELDKAENVFVIPEKDRVDVQWGADSMVIATMKLIHFMLDVKKMYDYVFLISGQDYPIKSNTEIQEFLNDNYGQNFIEVIEHSDKLYKRYSKRNEIFYPKCLIKTSIPAKIIKKIYIYLTGGHNHTFRALKRKNEIGLSFEFGSQWWCMTFDCLKWVADYIDKNNIMSFFENTLTPDECLFQTVFMASPYKNTRNDKLTYLEWSENKNNPRVLTIDDYEILKRSNCLFARKFDISVDKRIIERLNNEGF